MTTSFGPGPHSEHDALLGYLDAQLAAVRTAAYGLTTDQARATPCRSSLSVGGLVKHVLWVMRQRVEGPVELDEAGFGAYLGSFALTDDETIEGVLAEFDAAREAYLADVRAHDPGEAMTEPPAPWDGRPEPIGSVQRFALLHHVEEFARHAGHADVIREQLDGADAMSLKFAAEGLPGNAFVQPWQPAG